MESHGLFSWLVLNSSYLLPFLFSLPLILPSLTGSTSGSERLSLSSSGLALQQPRCAIRGHSKSAELFYILDGQLQLLAGSQVITASKGDLVVVPPNMAHAFATTPSQRADFLIVQAPGLPRLGYFRLVERLSRGEARLEELLTSQELYDNHFRESPIWQAARASAHHHE